MFKQAKLKQKLVTTYHVLYKRTEYKAGTSEVQVNKWKTTQL